MQNILTATPFLISWKHRLQVQDLTLYIRLRCRGTASGEISYSSSNPDRFSLKICELPGQIICTPHPRAYNSGQPLGNCTEDLLFRKGWKEKHAGVTSSQKFGNTVWHVMQLLDENAVLPSRNDSSWLLAPVSVIHPLPYEVANFLEYFPYSDICLEYLDCSVVSFSLELSLS